MLFYLLENTAYSIKDKEWSMRSIINLWSKQGAPFIYSKLQFILVKRHKRVKTQSKWHNDRLWTNVAELPHLVFEWVWQIQLRSRVPRLKNWWRSCRGEELPNCPHTFLNKTQQADTILRDEINRDICCCEMRVLYPFKDEASLMYT